MHEEPSRLRRERGAILGRAIVLTLLGEDRPEGWTCAELASELAASPAAVEDVVRGLCDEGVLSSHGLHVHVSRAARRLDELGLIGV